MGIPRMRIAADVLAEIKALDPDEAEEKEALKMLNRSLLLMLGGVLTALAIIVTD